MFRFPRWTSGSLRIPTHNGTITVKRARIKTVPRYGANDFNLFPADIYRFRTTIFFTGPLLILAGIQASKLLVPKDVRDHLETLEKDWDDFKKKRAELDKELGRNIQNSELSNIAKGGNSKPPVFAPIWIPIPIWTTLKKAPEYKPTDLEWKEFLKLEQDPDRVKKLKREIARTVATGILDGLPPPVERAWGFDGKVSCDSGHIDFVFPFSPPNIYERPGLLVTTSGIKWTSQELPDDRGRRFYRIFHPTVFAQAFWAGGKAFYRYHYNSFEKWISERFGEQPKKSPSKTASKGFKGFSAAEQALLKKAFTISSSLTSIDLQDASELLKVLLPPPSPKSAMEAAVNAYKRKQTHMQVAKWKECPRGGCYLTGHVDIRGTKATIRASVKAIYIPSQDIFLGSPIIGEAIVMPKLSMMTADKLKIEKLKAESDGVRSAPESAQTDRERLQEKMKAERAKRVSELLKRLEKDETEKAKRVSKLWERLEKDNAALGKDGSGLEKAKTESQPDEGLTPKERQKKMDVARAESAKSVEEAKEEALRVLQKPKTETQPEPHQTDEGVKIDAAKPNSGQGPPDEK
jgi:hypothetical protein